MTASVPAPHRPRNRRRRRLIAAAAGTIGIATIGLTPTSAAAEQRDPCQDAANQARVDLDIAHGWWVVGMALYNAGYDDAADEAFGAMDYFMAAYEVHMGDAERC